MLRGFMVVQIFKMAERSDSFIGETLLAPYARKKKVQIKMAKRVGAEENIGIFIYRRKSD